MKSSKQKQQLYNNFLKSRTKENEANYKAYEDLFETIKINRKEPVTLNYLQHIETILKINAINSVLTL